MSRPRAVPAHLDLSLNTYAGLGRQHRAVLTCLMMSGSFRGVLVTITVTRAAIQVRPLRASVSRSQTCRPSSLLDRKCIRKQVSVTTRGGQGGATSFFRVHVRCGGSPHAHRAWPLAWPSPSGPPGAAEAPRARVGPEDAFCGAGFAERLERIFGALAGGGADLDNARRSGPVAVTSFRRSAYLARA
jgi:hypothetical protein